MPPTNSPADLCALAIANDAGDDWQFWVSEKLISLSGDVLLGKLGKQFRKQPFSEAGVEHYQQELREIAKHSGGDITEPQMRVFGLFGDEEDDKNVGSLAVTVGAQVIVTADKGIRAVGKQRLPLLGGKSGLVLFISDRKFVDHVHASRQR